MTWDASTTYREGLGFFTSIVDAVDDASWRDPATWWSHLATNSRAALEGVEDLDREVDSPRGRRTVREGLSFPAVDLFVHGWDLGTATGQRVAIPNDAIAFVETTFANIPSDVSRRPGVFANELDAPVGASPTDRLIAFTGRDPQWAMPPSA